MSHQCLRCSALHQDMIMRCSCGSTAFLMLKDDAALPRQVCAELLLQVEQDPQAEARTGPTVIDADDLGKYDIDLGALLSGNEVGEPQEGKYTIDLAKCLRKH